MASQSLSQPTGPAGAASTPTGEGVALVEPAAGVGRKASRLRVARPVQALVRILFLSLGGALLSAAFLRHGLLATEDSWMYWETSVSLLEHGRYAFLHGEPFLMEPPGVSVGFALIMALLGKTGAALVAGVCFFNLLSIAVWLVFLERVFGAANVAACGWAYWTAAVFVALFIAVHSCYFVANAVLLPVIGCVFLLCLKATRKAWPENRWQVIWLALAVAVASLVHNSGVLLAPAVLAALYRTAKTQPWLERLKAAGLFSALALGPYFVVWSRGFRAHASSGSKQSGEVLQRAVERAPEWLRGLGGLFLSEKPQAMFQAAMLLAGLALVVWMVWVVWSRRDPLSESFKAPVLAALLFALAHYAVFSLVYEPGPLSGRYFWFLPPAIAGPLCVWVWRRPAGREAPYLGMLAVAALAVLFFPNVLWRSARYFQRSVVTVAMSLPAYHGFIYPCYFLTSHVEEKAPRGFIAITPPTPPWMSRWDPAPDLALANGSLEFSPVDVINLGWLAESFQHPWDAVTAYLLPQLSQRTRDRLARYRGGPDPDLQRGFAQDFNRITEGGPIYDQQRFGKIVLSAKTSELLASRPQGAELVRLNRLLLLDAYPPELSKNTQKLVRAR